MIFQGVTKKAIVKSVKAGFLGGGGGCREVRTSPGMTLHLS